MAQKINPRGIARRLEIISLEQPAKGNAHCVVVIDDTNSSGNGHGFASPRPRTSPKKQKRREDALIEINNLEAGAGHGIYQGIWVFGTLRTR
jgi:hypothetical protein